MNAEYSRSTGENFNNRISTFIVRIDNEWSAQVHAKSWFIDEEGYLLLLNTQHRSIGDFRRESVAVFRDWLYFSIEEPKVVDGGVTHD